MIDKDYNGAVEVTDTLFEYYNSNNIDYYDDPKEFVRNCIHKKTENYKEHIVYEINNRSHLSSNTEKVILL